MTKQGNKVEAILSRWIKGLNQEEVVIVLDMRRLETKFLESL